jgi:HrpA-like RNA helicase
MKTSRRPSVRKSSTSRTSRSTHFDPLDAAGKGPNILTGATEFSDERQEWAKVWSKFPVYALKEKLRALVDSVEKNKVTVIVSGTGSGKTVLAVPLVMSHVVKSALHDDSAKVAVTIPKRAAVAAAAERGAITMDVKLGEEVGYLHRGAPSWSYDDRKTRLVYATDGTLLAQIRRDPLLTSYGAVVVDEAHERPVPTDLLLAALKRALLERPEFRLVIMSATIDPKLFVDYYGALKLSTGIVEVSGATMHPIERVHSVLPGAVDGAPPKEYLPSTLEQACKVLTSASKNPPNIIVFVPTTKDSSQGCRALDKTCKTSNKECFSLYGKMSSDDKNSALKPKEEGDDRARVYVSTNVAESSLTLDGITHVIDTGLQLSSTWDPRAHGSRIVKGMATQAQITQRIGRAGRTGPGKAILLYSKEKFEAQPAYPPPAILGVDLAEHTLAELASSGEKTIEAVHAHFASLITPPTRSQVVGSISALHFYGLVEITAFDASALAASVTPYSLIPYDTLAPPEEVETKKKASSKKEKDKPSSSRKKTQGGGETDPETPPPPPKWVSPFKGRVTPLGKLVQRVSDTAKLGIWGSLMVVAGAAYDCVDDAYELAVILESCEGELSTLWKEQATPDRSPDTVKLLKDTELAKLHPQSDHAALLGFYRQNVAPRTRENKRIAEKHLAFGPWQKVSEAIRRDRGKTIAFVTEKKGEVSEWFGKLPHIPLNSKEHTSVSPLIRTIAASRAYLACNLLLPPKQKLNQNTKAVNAATPPPSNAGSKMRTLFPITKVEVSVDQPITVLPTAIPPNAVAFTESIVNAGGQWKAGGITWVPHEALSSWMAMEAAKKPPSSKPNPSLSASKKPVAASPSKKPTTIRAKQQSKKMMLRLKLMA